MAQYNDFHYGLSLLDTLYGINLPEETYEEIALVGWSLIGNKRAKLYRYSVCLQPCQESIELPCNCDILEAVSADFEDFQHVDNDSPDERYGSFDTEQYIERYKHFQEPLYTRGKFVNYERVGNTLYIGKNHNGGRIHILYRGLVLDDDGLPEITDKEAMALATYCAWITKFKDGLATSNTTTINLANTLKAQWQVQCDQARTDFEWTQNNYDEILDVKTCWDRKLNNKSYKLIR